MPREQSLLQARNGSQMPRCHAPSASSENNLVLLVWEAKTTCGLCPALANAWIVWHKLQALWEQPVRSRGCGLGSWIPWSITSWHSLENTVNVQLYAQLKQTKTQLWYFLRFSIYMRELSVNTCKFCYFMFRFSQHFVKDSTRDRSCPHVCRTSQAIIDPCAQNSTGCISSVVCFEGGDGMHEPRETQVLHERGSLLTACSPNSNILFSFCHRGRIQTSRENKDYLNCTKSFFCKQCFTGLLYGTGWRASVQSVQPIGPAVLLGLKLSLTEGKLRLGRRAEHF